MSSQEVKFLQNAWYVAALSTEVNETDFFNRKIIGTSIMIYRKSDGELVALHDRCPHRFTPLSLGKREGDEVVCIYHGLKFDCTGKCTDSPHGNGKIPKAAVVQSYKLVEREGFIWIWMGEADKADADDIIDMSIISQVPENSRAWEYMHNSANYELIVDNIMDLTHIDHLHGPLINTGGQLSPLIADISDTDKSIKIRWDWTATPMMKLLGDHLPDPQGDAEAFLEVNWYPPSNMSLSVGCTQKQEHDDEAYVVLDDFHIMTPETETTTHYFFASTRNYLQDSKEYNDMKKIGMREAFTLEDKPVIEAQQDEMGTADLWSLNPVLLSSDAGNVRVRRRLQQLIALEE